MTSRSMITGYMPLLNEGNDVWRPVDLLPIHNGVFQIQSKCPPDERWKFETGKLVRCEEQMLSSGPALVITSLQTSTKE